MERPQNVLNSVDDAFVKVGAPTAMFRPPRIRFAVGAFAMMLFAAFPLTLFFVGPNGRPARPGEEAIVVLVMGIGAFALGVGILVFGLRAQRHRYYLCPKGLVVTSGGSVEIYLWNDITKVIENNVDDNFHGISLGTSRSAMVHRADGAQLLLTRNRVSRVGELIDAIQQRVLSCRALRVVAPLDPQLAQVAAAWPHLPDDARREAHTYVQNALSTQPTQLGSSNDMHVALRVAQSQIDRGEVVTLNVPGVASYQIKLIPNFGHGTMLRLPNALPNGGNLVARILVDY